MKTRSIFVFIEKIQRANGICTSKAMLEIGGFSLELGRVKTCVIDIIDVSSG